jgi:hypothetical protein
MTSQTSGSTVKANKSLTKIVGKPTALDIATLQREVIENAGNMNNPNSKQYGHIGMMMSDVEFQKFAKDSGATGAVTAWKAPREAGERPQFKKGDNKEEHQLLVNDWTYNNEVEEKFMNGKKELKSQIIDAVEAQYLRKVRNKTDTTHGKGPKELLDHLKTTYGIVTGCEIGINRKKLNNIWDGKTPITEMWESIADIRELAKYANSPICANELIIAVLESTEQIPDFVEVVRQYYRTLPTTWDWDKMVTDFTAVDNGRDNKTTGERGYHAANAATDAKAKARPPPIHPKTDKHQFVSTYCHSHGWQMDRKHNSETCPDPKEGHDKTATAHDMKGGSQLVSFKRTAYKKATGERSPKK